MGPRAAPGELAFIGVRPGPGDGDAVVPERRPVVLPAVAVARDGRKEEGEPRRGCRRILDDQHVLVCGRDEVVQGLGRRDPGGRERGIVDVDAHVAVVDRRADERMQQAARGLRLATEAHPHLRVTREVRVHDLHGQRAPKLFMFRGVDVRHAARSEAADDAVPVAHGLPEHRDDAVGHLGGRAHLRQHRRARGARFGRTPVPGAAIRAEPVCAFVSAFGRLDIDFGLPAQQLERSLVRAQPNHQIPQQSI